MEETAIETKAPEIPDPPNELWMLWCPDENRWASEDLYDDCGEIGYLVATNEDWAKRIGESLTRLFVRKPLFIPVRVK